MMEMICGTGDRMTYSNLTLASARNFLSKSQRKKTSRLGNQRETVCY